MSVDQYNPHGGKIAISHKCTHRAAQHSLARHLYTDADTHTCKMVYLFRYRYRTAFYRHHHTVLHDVLFHSMIYLDNLILHMHTLLLEGYTRANSILLVGTVNGDKTLYSFLYFLYHVAVELLKNGNNRGAQLAQWVEHTALRL